MFQPSTTLGRLVLAVVYGLIAGLVVFVIGAVLLGIGISFGSVVEGLAVVIGIIAALAFFFFGNRAA